MIAHVGIDVSKKHLDIALHPQKDVFRISNTLEALTALAERLKPYAVERVLLEATGGYEKLALQVLTGLGLKVVRINPVRVRNFAKAMGKNAKTDKIDAKMLALFSSKLENEQAAVVDEVRDTLNELVTQRQFFVQQRDDIRRRVKQITSEVVRTAYLQQIKTLDDQVKKIDVLIEAKSSEIDSKSVQRLRAIKGMGPVTISSLLCFLPELGSVSGKHIAALVGVAPFNNDSGDKTGERHIYGGRGRLRRALYMCVLSMTRFNPAFKARYAALRARGKCAKVAMVACMRVLAVRLNAMIKNDQDWMDEPAR